MNASKHRIEPLNDHVQPIYSAPYRAGLKTRKVEKVKMFNMIEQKVIEPEQTERVAPIDFAIMKGRTLRLCADYRRLNALKKRDSYPIAHMNEVVYSLGKAKVFSTQNANSGY